jgi:hypothetical protein
MLLPEHERFHKLGPNETIKADAKQVMEIQVARQTSTTGEQIAIGCPVYADDTREELNARLGMVYSILQDRLEEENKAMLNLTEKAKERKRQAEEEEEKRKDELHKKELARQAEIAEQRKATAAARKEAREAAKEA